MRARISDFQFGDQPLSTPYKPDDLARLLGAVETVERREDGFVAEYEPHEMNFYSNLMAGVCFALQAVLLRKYSASQISVFSFATPLVGVAMSVLLRGDQLSPWLLASGMVVACGILLVNLPNGKPVKAE